MAPIWRWTAEAEELLRLLNLEDVKNDVSACQSWSGSTRDRCPKILDHEDLDSEEICKILLPRVHRALPWDYELNEKLSRLVRVAICPLHSEAEKADLTRYWSALVQINRLYYSVYTFVGYLVDTAKENEQKLYGKLLKLAQATEQHKITTITGARYIPQAIDPMTHINKRINQILHCLGTDPSALSQWPPMEMSEQPTGSSRSSSHHIVPQPAVQICPVCTSEAEDIHRTPCGHEFCFQCVTAWMNEQIWKGTLRDPGPSCPICRRELWFKDLERVKFPLEAKITKRKELIRALEALVVEMRDFIDGVWPDIKKVYKDEEAAKIAKALEDAKMENESEDAWLERQLEYARNGEE